MGPPFAANNGFHGDVAPYATSAGRRRSADGTLITTCDPDRFIDEFLSDAHHLEIHSKDRRPGSVARATVRFAVDPIQHGIDLELVVALDVLEAVRPGIRTGYLILIRKWIAAHALRAHAGQGHRDRVGVRSKFGSFRTIATPHHHKMRRLQRRSHGTSYAEISLPVIVEK